MQKPVQSYQGHDSPFFMLCALNSLRICFLEVISVSSHTGIQGDQATTISLHGWQNELCFCVQSTLWSQGSLSHDQLWRPQLPRMRCGTDRFPPYSSGPCHYTPCFNPQCLTLKPSAREHNSPDSSHPWKQTSSSTSNPPHISRHHSACCRVPLYPL